MHKIKQSPLTAGTVKKNLQETIERSVTSDKEFSSMS